MINGTETIKTTVHFWRDYSGPEVDWLLYRNQSLLPIQARWTDNPSLRDAKHLELFMKEYPLATKAFVVCRVPRPQLLAENIEAISWRDLIQKLSNW